MRSFRVSVSVSEGENDLFKTRRWSLTDVGVRIRRKTRTKIEFSSRECTEKMSHNEQSILFLFSFKLV